MPAESPARPTHDALAAVFAIDVTIVAMASCGSIGVTAGFFG
jgi:hypothetical protein